MSAGDWIKMRTNLWDDPRVVAVCDRLAVSEAVVVGGLFRLWSIADDHSLDGRLAGLTPAGLDRKAGVPGFAEAVAAVGWLTFDDDGAVIVRFEEHNGQSAKRRSLDAKRKASAREADNMRTKTGRRAEGSRKECGPRTRGRTREREELEGKASYCSEPPSAASEPPVLEFPVVGPGPSEWPLTASKVAEYAESYPALDVMAECRKALQWCRDNPAKRKTAGGMAKFLGSWLGRANDRGGTSRGHPPVNGHDRLAAVDEFIRQNGGR